MIALLSTKYFTTASSTELHHLHALWIASFELAMGQSKGAEVRQYVCVVSECITNAAVVRSRTH
jgi:hypothetical protein